MYTDDELHKMCDAAMQRGDQILVAALIAVAVAHEHDMNENLLGHLLMWTDFHMKHGAQQEGGSNDRGQDALTAIDPSAVIRL